MFHAVEPEEAFDPVNVGLLRSDAVATNAHHFTNAGEERTGHWLSLGIKDQQLCDFAARVAVENSARVIRRKASAVVGGFRRLDGIVFLTPSAYPAFSQKSKW